MSRPAEHHPDAVRDQRLDALVRGEPVDAFAVLGRHGDRIRTFQPGARGVEVLDAATGALLVALHCHSGDGVFEGSIVGNAACRLRIHWPDAVQEVEDAYSFGLLLGALDLHLFHEGRHRQLGRMMGAQPMSVDGVPGVRFAVWAPNARRVSVVGAFNHWDGRRHVMRRRIEAGIWELFLPRLEIGALYQFEIVGADGDRWMKADPFARQTEAPPGTASVVAATPPPVGALAHRDERQGRDAPIAIYEVHAGSWQRNDFGSGSPPDWDQLAERLVPYVANLNFTHIELMPIAEYPFGGSWGYQPLGLYAPTARHGAPEAFARFVAAAHAAGIGVIVDWVPAHFPADAHGLRRFDGTALFEHEDPREGYHPDWNTLIYNHGRPEVSGFLIGAALHFIEHYGVDGLRVDAVASMLHRDYSRRAGEWVPNRFGGRENLEAVAFVRELNRVVAERCPGAMVIAEESTSWPGVTADTRDGGLGFAYKWNMGWMHDTLKYMAREPIHRHHHHADITFGLMYAHAEAFVLPLSHDEVVHLKKSLVAKFAGDSWQRHAGLRAYYGLMWGYPGKKLLFMGGEIAQEREWNHDRELDWFGLRDSRKRGMQRYVGDLNRLYRDRPALHRGDCDTRGFQWIVVDDAANSVFAWLRLAPDHSSPPVLVICHFTPRVLSSYRIGVPSAGRWREILNSDAAIYGGSNIGNVGGVVADAIPSHDQPASLELTIPPLASLWLELEQ
ncbi:1,4-alpha-glucan branching protein GlgB [Nevskia sp.]|uniref:1,4-alpha-glucan branching protein GlgB n=1 Tax=Nevskia sp. TaxID=1929292 RepID=UPI0025CF9522|nr:1,4-alpha-glucan branching protein GlgB [Nevskia sp.]